MASGTSFTGRARKRRTTPIVGIKDFLARGVITIGGISTIVAVLTVLVFLFAVAAPLFRAPTVSPQAGYSAPWDKKPLRMGLDEYQVLGWALLPDGTFEVFRADNGKRIAQLRTFADRQLTSPTAAAFSLGAAPDAAFGFSDGTVSLGKVSFATAYLRGDEAPAHARNLQPGEMAAHEEGVVECLREGEYRQQSLRVRLDDPIVGKSSAPIRAIDFVVTTNGPIVCTLHNDGALEISSSRDQPNMLTGQTTRRTTTGVVPFAQGDQGLPDHVVLAGLGDNLMLLWKDGRLERYDCRSVKNPKLVEKTDLLPEEGATVSVAQLLLGRRTLLVADSGGGLSAWFRIKPDHAETADGTVFVKAHEWPPQGSPITALASSSRSRVVAAGHADGTARLFQVTTNALLAEVPGDGRPIVDLVVAPRDDGLLAATGGGLARWSVDLMHPEGSLSAMFLPQWYEGYNEPGWTWQSSAATDDQEPKLSLVPLVFGTLKATFYSLLIGVPLALLAAVYGSEFLHPRWKARIKPTIELMASLPSVVLGFLAGLVIAPYLEDFVPAAIASLGAVPLTIVGGAYVWQLLPEVLTRKLAPYRLWFLLLLVPAGIGLALVFAPAVERLLFAGDIKAWLNGQIGTAVGGWMLLFLPLSGLLVLLLGREVNGRLRSVSREWGRTKLAAVDAGKFLVGLSLTVVLAWLLSWILSSASFDPRGTSLLDYLGTYDQRNTLIVGFMMGFAIIPIIYTLADDALSSVPQHLRSASLGAGATPWQTATRIVIPTAMSGLFSAVMVGLGRAVGETMVVLMAAGNTPLMEMNIFNGFRTLAANIATEMPEAVKDSTHYRILFFAALTLFALTFVVNTVAEVVRLRFRRRAYEL